MIVSMMSTRHVGELVDNGKIHFSTKNPFIENGYDSQQLKEIVRYFEEKRSTNRTSVADNDEQSKIITLPWIPGLSPKLRKTYRSSV